MLRREVDIKRNRPIPISVLIQTTNEFGCDIFIQCEELKVNAKSYDDVKQHLITKEPQLLFCFSGIDEEEAEHRIQTLFRV